MQTPKQQKIAKFNRIMRATCSGSMKGSYQTVGDIKHMCEAVIGEYVSATEWVEHFIDYEKHNTGLTIKMSEYRAAREATPKGDYSSNGHLWKNIKVYMPVTQRVFSEFYHSCRNGELGNLLK